MTLFVCAFLCAAVAGLQSSNVGNTVTETTDRPITEPGVEQITYADKARGSDRCGDHRSGKVIHVGDRLTGGLGRTPSGAVTSAIRDNAERSL